MTDAGAAQRYSEVEAQLSQLAALAEPIRRRLYRFVAEQSAPTSRDEAAAGVGIARHVAKFHLDRLAEDGLLDVEYRRPPGRTGPGAGRPTKLYRPAHDEVAASVPERHYDLAADILASAVTASQASGAPVEDALRAVAREAGERLAHSHHPSDPAEPLGAADAIAAVTRLLTDYGYEPAAEPADGEQHRIILRNCPFHRLAARHTNLVCGLNLDLLDGVLDARPDVPLRAQLDPAPGRCCVTLRSADAAALTGGPPAIP